MNKQWIVQNSGMLILAAAVFVEWIALQALVIHYHLFRKNLKKPRPDGIRFDLIEKTLEVHTENSNALFRKLAELRKEIAMVANAQPTRPQRSEHSSIETSVMSLGEMNFKKRLQEMSAAATEPKAN